jgi:flagellar hook protein FlgE
MTISSSLNASVAGLSANASRLATISDNIANSSTFGYKRAVTDFHSMVIDSGRGTYSAGGVRTTTQRLIDERGPLLSTSNATDLAVRGRGFLPVTREVEVNLGASDSSLLLTTTGSFRPDENGYLRTSSGLILMGWPADSDGTVPTFPRDTRVGLEPIRLNTNQFIGEPTTAMNLAMNLPATDTEAGADGDPRSLSIEYFDNLGKSARLSVAFTPTVPATGASNEWTVTLTDGASGGTVVGEYTLTFDDTRGAGGTLLSVANTTGGAYNPTTGTFQINVAGGPIDVKLGELGAPDGITQLSDAFAPVNITKNGSPAGNLTSVEIDPNGYVHASYDVGISRVIFQVPLVDVPNQNGLESMDNETYGITPDSGSFFLWDAGDGPTGDVVSYAQEESSTDVAGELTSLIQTQRAYSSNAKVIQTVDEMLQETTNIKR